MKLKRLSSGGMTLVELLVSIVVATVILGSLNQVVTSYLHVSQRGRYLNLANSYAEAKIETLRNLGYNGINSGTTNLSSELPSQLPPKSTASMTVTTPLSGIKRIDLSLTYRDNAQSNTYNYTTYVGELGVGQ